MIRIYAVDPDVVTEPLAFSPIVRELGVSHGRLVAEFPSSWRKQLKNKASAMGDTREGLQVQALVQDICLNSWKRTKLGLEYDADSSWLENACKKGSAFSAVLHASDAEDVPVDPHLHPAIEVLMGAGFWTTQREVPITGGPRDLVEVLAPLLQLDSSVAIMDPWYSPTSSDYQKTFTELFRAVPTLTDIVVHASGHSSAGASVLASDEWAAACDDALLGHCTNGRTFNVVRWRAGESRVRPHRRWIASPYGAISLDRGLQTRHGNHGTLMDQDYARQRWQQYAPRNWDSATEFDFFDAWSSKESKESKEAGPH